MGWVQKQSCELLKTTMYKDKTKVCPQFAIFNDNKSLLNYL